MKNILVPVDFSDCSTNAAKTAINLCSILNADIDFVHVMNTPVDWVKLSLEEENKYLETKRKIAHAKVELSKLIKLANLSGVSARRSLNFSRTGSEIFSKLNDHQYDMVVMGTHGERSIGRSILGSNTIAVIRQSSIPILVVKEEIEVRISRMVFASDFNEINVSPYHLIINLADRLNSQLDLLFIKTPNSADSNQRISIKMDKLLSHCTRDVKCIKNRVNAESVIEGLRIHIEKNKTDIICICTHDRNVIERIFNSSIAEKVCEEIDLPILIIKDV